jgi:hypothetical protein
VNHLKSLDYEQKVMLRNKLNELIVTDEINMKIFLHPNTVSSELVEIKEVDKDDKNWKA